MEDLEGKLWSGIRVVEFKVTGKDHFKVMAVPKR